MTIEKKVDLLKVAAIVLPIAITALVFYGKMENTPENINEIRTKLASHDTEIAVIKNDLIYMRNGIQELVESDRRRRSRIDDRNPR